MEEFYKIIVCMIAIILMAVALLTIFSSHSEIKEINKKVDLISRKLGIENG